MRRKPGLLGRTLAAIVLVIGASACAQILGDDFVIDDNGPSSGGGDCDEDCAGCPACALASECEFERDDCDLLGCEPYGECCLNCPTRSCDDAVCDCGGRDARHFARESCILSVCAACGGNVASVGVGGT